MATRSVGDDDAARVTSGTPTTPAPLSAQRKAGETAMAILSLDQHEVEAAMAHAEAAGFKAWEDWTTALVLAHLPADPLAEPDVEEPASVSLAERAENAAARLLATPSALVVPPEKRQRVTRSLSALWRAIGQLEALAVAEGAFAAGRLGESSIASYGAEVAQQLRHLVDRLAHFDVVGDVRGFLADLADGSQDGEDGQRQLIALADRIAPAPADQEPGR